MNPLHPENSLVNPPVYRYPDDPATLTKQEQTMTQWERDVNRELLLVLAERHRQLKKWGLQSRSLDKWLVILAEENGEVAKAICDLDNDDTPEAREHIRQRIREEAIQVAAVALAIAQHIATGEAV